MIIVKPNYTFIMYIDHYFVRDSKNTFSYIENPATSFVGVADSMNIGGKVLLDLAQNFVDMHKDYVSLHIENSNNSLEDDCVYLVELKDNKGVAYFKLWCQPIDGYLFGKQYCD